MFDLILEIILFFGSVCVTTICALAVLALMLLVVYAVINISSRRRKGRATKNVINALKALDKINGNGLEVVSKLMQAHGAHFGTKERIKREGRDGQSD